MNVTAATYEQEVLQSGRPVLVDYYADWCAPCHAVAPVLDRLAAKYGLKLVKVDVDEEQVLASNAGVSGIPHIQLVRGGTVVAKSIGAKPLSKLESELGLEGISGTE